MFHYLKYIKKIKQLIRSILGDKRREEIRITLFTATNTQGINLLLAYAVIILLLARKDFKEFGLFRAKILKIQKCQYISDYLESRTFHRQITYSFKNCM